jgi:DNA-binding transcriptional LysR family regulator
MEIAMGRFESLKVFVTVVEAGGFSAASRRLNMPLASVSRKVAELERHLKVRLLDRSTRRVRPSDGGASFYRACRRILDDLAEAERTAAGEYASPRGELAVTAPIVFGRLHLLPVICDFLAAYPEITVRLQLSDRILDLAEEEIDAAVRIGDLPASSLIAVRLGEVRRVVCASPAYVEKRGTPTHPRELAGHDCISFASFEAPRAWTFREGGASVDHAIAPRLTVNSAEAAIDAALHGPGLTRVLSYQVAAAVAKGELVILLADFEPRPMPVHLVHGGGRPVPRKLQALVDFAAPRLRARLQPA